MTIKTELLNLITGLLLVLCGVINLIQRDFVMGMNWIVFGSMYLVMDDYLQNKSMETLLERTADWCRRIFSWIGLVGSIILVGYYIHRFWL